MKNAPKAPASFFFALAVTLASGFHVRGGTGRNVSGSLFTAKARAVEEQSAPVHVILPGPPPADSGVCWKNTGGFCGTEPCFEIRGPTDCILGKCYCAPGSCSDSEGICRRTVGRELGAHAIRSLTEGIGNGKKYLAVEYGFKPFDLGDPAWLFKGPNFYTAASDRPQQWLFYDTGDGHVRIESAEFPGNFLSMTLDQIMVKNRESQPPVVPIDGNWKLIGDQLSGVKIWRPLGNGLVRMNSFRLFPQMKEFAHALAVYVFVFLFILLVYWFYFLFIFYRTFNWGLESRREGRAAAAPRACTPCMVLFQLFFIILILWMCDLFDPDYGVAICFGDITCMGRQEFRFEPPLDEGGFLGIIGHDGLWDKPRMVRPLCEDRKNFCPIEVLVVVLYIGFLALILCWPFYYFPRYREAVFRI